MVVMAVVMVVRIKIINSQFKYRGLKLLRKKEEIMTRVLQEKLSKLREDLIQNKQKETLINISVHELSMIITGLKMSNAFDNVLDEEIQIKHNRSMKNKLNRKS